MEGLKLRPARAGDLDAINAIYNYYVEHSTCTYQMEPCDKRERSAWFEEHGAEHPVVVAETGGEVLGWAALFAYSERRGYRHTVADSVCVRSDSLRRGIGAALLEELIRLGKAAGRHSIIAAISADQEPSIALHRKFGFEQVGHLREVGHKFDKWLDVVWMQLIL